jgi:hypothetical protein
MTFVFISALVISISKSLSGVASCQGHQDKHDVIVFAPWLPRNKAAFSAINPSPLPDVFRSIVNYYKISGESQINHLQKEECWARYACHLTIPLAIRPNPAHEQNTVRPIVVNPPRTTKPI